MSSSYSANQYASAFNPHRLQNWGETKHFKQRPSARVGHTSFIADDRGHLLPGVKRSSAWPSFKGTWDLPAHIPAPHTNPTARSEEGLNRLKSWGIWCETSKCQSVRHSRNTQQDEGTQISFQEENVEVTPPCTTEAQPSAQNRPPTQSSASAAHAAPLHPTCAAGMDKSSSNHTAEAQGLAGDGSEGKPQLESSSNILQVDTQR
ncbi:protein Flattop [Oryzias melastigma]|uniref:protein Flattop n=1 Tax=Oryzias melastigma TaxID=30732 RepID=UPI000CF826D6|nr:protein Flattop [Oryzias melastigma]